MFWYFACSPEAHDASPAPPRSLPPPPSYYRAGLGHTHHDVAWCTSGCCCLVHVAQADEGHDCMQLVTWPPCRRADASRPAWRGPFMQGMAIRNVECYYDDARAVFPFLSVHVVASKPMMLCSTSLPCIMSGACPCPSPLAYVTHAPHMVWPWYLPLTFYRPIHAAHGHSQRGLVHRCNVAVQHILSPGRLQLHGSCCCLWLTQQAHAGHGCCPMHAAAHSLHAGLAAVHSPVFIAHLWA